MIQHYRVISAATLFFCLCFANPHLWSRRVNVHFNTPCPERGLLGFHSVHPVHPLLHQNLKFLLKSWGTSSGDRGVSSYLQPYRRFSIACSFLFPEEYSQTAGKACAFRALAPSTSWQPAIFFSIWGWHILALFPVHPHFLVILHFSIIYTLHYTISFTSHYVYEAKILRR